MGPATEWFGVLKKLTDLLPKIKAPVQLAGLVAVVLAVILSKKYPLEAAGIAGLGMLFLTFGQVFAQVDKVPASKRSFFLLGALMLFIVAFALNLVFAYYALGCTKCPPDRSSEYPPSDRIIIEMTPEVFQIEADYVSLLERPDKAGSVNRRARQLAERLLAVEDGPLSLGIQIYKYETVSYALAMVEGSEADANAKLKTVADILKATKKGEELVADAMLIQIPETRKAQNTRNWIINDNALPRLQRLKAIALCARWQVNKKEQDRLDVQALIDGFPPDYLHDERPQKSSELRPCLVNQVVK